MRTCRTTAEPRRGRPPRAPRVGGAAGMERLDVRALGRWSGCATLVPELLAWSRSRRAWRWAPSNAALVQAVERARLAARRERSPHPAREAVVGIADEDVRLPPGLRIAELEDDEIERYNVAVMAAFGHVGGSPEEYATRRARRAARHDRARASTAGRVAACRRVLERREFEAGGDDPEASARHRLDREREPARVARSDVVEIPGRRDATTRNSSP